LLKQFIGMALKEGRPIALCKKPAASDGASSAANRTAIAASKPKAEASTDRLSHYAWLWELENKGYSGKRVRSETLNINNTEVERKRMRVS
jgi:hypothetical protein